MRSSTELEQQVQTAQERLDQIQAQALACGEESPLLLETIVDLSVALEELGVATEEIQQRNDELLVTLQTLAEERQHYQDLFELAPDAYLVTNTQGIIEAINGVAENLLNIRRDRAVGKPLTVFIADTDHRFIYGQLAQFRAKTPRQSKHQQPAAPSSQPPPADPPPPAVLLLQEQEVVLRPRDGDLIPSMLSLSVKRDRQGNPLFLYWVFHDLRQRKHVEIALQERDRQLEAQVRQWEALFAQALEAIAIVDDTGHYLDVNPAACVLFGAPREVLLASGVTDFVDPNLDVASLWQTFLAQGQMTGEFQLHCPNGVIRDAELNAIANFVPGQHLAILRDITDRKHTELALQQSEAKNRAILAAIPDLMLRIGTDGVYREVFNVGCQFKVLAIDAVGRPMSEVLPPDIVVQSDYHLQQALVTGELQVFEHQIPIGDRIQYEEVRVIKSGEDEALFIIRDISDRKYAELALRESEEKFRLFAENSHAIIWIADPVNLEPFYVNAAYETIWGRSRQSLTDNPSSWLEAIHPEDRDQVERQLQEQRQSETSQAEYRIVRPDGSVRWIWDWGFAIRNEAGEVYRYAGLAEDITDRKQAELTLKQQIRQEYLLADIALDIRRSLHINDVLSRTVHRVREFLQSDRAIIFRFHPNREGEIIMESVVAAYPSILGMTISDLGFREPCVKSYQQGRIATVTDIEAEALAPCYAELLRSLHVKANVAVPILQGEELWGLLIAHHCTAPRQWQPDEIALLQRLANQVGIAIQQAELYQNLQTELADRQLAEKKIKEQATLLDIASDAIFVRDLNNRILYWNQGAERIYGWSAAEVLGQKADELLKDTNSPITAILKKLENTGEWYGEIENTTKTGKTVTVATRWTLVQDDTGQPNSILAVDTDITEKKQLEAQFYRAQRLESLGTLASGIAHDLNNVFTPILACAQLLKMKHPDLEARSHEMLQLLEDSAKRGANLIKQILTFTRGTGGDRRPVLVGPLLQEVISVAQQTFPPTITVQANLPEPCPWTIAADPTHLHQVCLNLCVNARDAMPDGGTLSLSLDTADVDDAFVHTHPDAQVGHYVVMTIADTGTGISKKIRDRIFEPFFTTKPHGQGTGLGLATVLGIVRDYGGFIQFHSTVGQGTQFQIYLPLRAEQTADTPLEAIAPAGQGEQLLLVDDDRNVLTSIQAWLESHQYRVLSAASGEDAIALYREHPTEIQVVLVDIMMPQMSGFTLIQRLQTINPAVKTIAVSGLPANREPAIAAGATAFLQKPYSPETLLQTLQTLLIATH